MLHDTGDSTHDSVVDVRVYRHFVTLFVDALDKRVVEQVKALV
jgi:hypothetical protein